MIVKTPGSQKGDSENSWIPNSNRRRSRVLYNGKIPGLIWIRFDVKTLLFKITESSQSPLKK